LLWAVDIDKLDKLSQKFITSPWQFCFKELSPYQTGNMLFFFLKNKKLMKGKAHRKHSPHEKTAASALLKLFISGNE